MHQADITSYLLTLPVSKEVALSPPTFIQGLLISIDESTVKLVIKPYCFTFATHCIDDIAVIETTSTVPKEFPLVIVSFHTLPVLLAMQEWTELHHTLHGGQRPFAMATRQYALNYLPSQDFIYKEQHFLGQLST